MSLEETVDGFELMSLLKNPRYFIPGFGFFMYRGMKNLLSEQNEFYAGLYEGRSEGEFQEFASLRSNRLIVWNIALMNFGVVLYNTMK